MCSITAFQRQSMFGMPFIDKYCFYNDSFHWKYGITCVYLLKKICKFFRVFVFKWYYNTFCLLIDGISINCKNYKLWNSHSIEAIVEKIGDMLDFGKTLRVWRKNSNKQITWIIMPVRFGTGLHCLQGTRNDSLHTWLKRNKCKRQTLHTVNNVSLVFFFYLFLSFYHFLLQKKKKKIYISLGMIGFLF
jgi:hypothetical protein